MHVIKLIGLVCGVETPWDGKYLKEYDPSRGDFPMACHLKVTDDPAQALLFQSFEQASECWKLVDTRDPVRDDGKPNRPLTAFTVEISEV